MSYYRSPARGSINRRIRAGAGAPAQARRAAEALPVREQARDRLALVVSELVTNSIRHAGLAAGDPIQLELTSENGQVWVAVHDGGPGFDPQTAIESSENGTGFGLGIVAAMADEWGVELGPAGCTVWCAVDEEATAA